MMELKLEECLKRADPAGLVSVLHREGLSSNSLSRLGQLVTQDLREHAVHRVLVVMKSLDLLAAKQADLQVLISHGLTSKVLLWFEALHHVITSEDHRDPAGVEKLSGSFYDLFMLLAQSSLPVSQLSAVLLHLAQFALEAELHFPVRLEAIRTFNSILESLSREHRRQIQNDQKQLQVMGQMAAALLMVGDYELQVSLAEALCRLTPRKEREQRANQWFSSCDISRAFCDITDRDFEVDCRHFLNFFNRFHGDQRRVYTFPCLTAFLESTQLFPPKDEQLDHFWIDFNITSECVSFFVDNPQGILWGSIHLLREEVQCYSFRLKKDGSFRKETILSVQLNNPIMHQDCSGQTVELTFEPEYQKELEDAARRVFLQERRAFPHAAQPDGSVQGSRLRGRVYRRKQAKSVSPLKILPLSSPSSSDEDSGVVKYVSRSSADLQFDHLRTSTPTYKSGVPLGVELNSSAEKTETLGGWSSPGRKELYGPSRKRSSEESGYRSGAAEVELAHKRVGPLFQEEAEPVSTAHLVSQHFPEWAEPATEEAAQTEAQEPKSDLTTGISTAFNSFRARLEEHFTGCWRDAETEVLQSVKNCQQQVSTLLADVHQQRLALLQTFENNIAAQLKHLQQTSAGLSSMNADILSWFRRERQCLSSFCEEHQQRLKSLDSRESTTHCPPDQ